MLTAAELDTQLTRASAYFSRGELAQAESMCRTVLAASPDNAAALHLLGLVRARGGDPQGGEDLLRRSVELEPADPRLRLNFATFLRRAGRLEEAERVYRRVLQLAPGERGARHGLALTLDSLGGPCALGRAPELGAPRVLNAVTPPRAFDPLSL